MWAAIYALGAAAIVVIVRLATTRIEMGGRLAPGALAVAVGLLWPVLALGVAQLLVIVCVKQSSVALDHLEGHAGPSPAPKPNPLPIKSFTVSNS